MSRLEMSNPGRAQVVVEGLYKELERRIESSPSGLCLIDMSKAFLELCHAQSCGKCVPCRVGLTQLKDICELILQGKAELSDIDLLESTAESIMETADCAIGYEAAEMIYKGVRECRDVYEAHIREKRCTCHYEQPVPCVTSCPAGVDIPGYIALVKEGRYKDAVRLIRKDNPFPVTCGFICEHPCEARCRRNMIDSPVNIRGLKKMACEFAGEVEPPKCQPSTGKKVAVIGGGPGGLSAAYYLQLMGHQAVIYESLEKLGGMLRYGIPNYRLPKDKLDEDVNAILKTGVIAKTNTYVGKDISIEELRKEYDAVLLTIGASTDKKLGIDHEDAKGVMSAVSFLRNVGKGKYEDLTGKEVCVIGGGNVSMDAVRSAVRLGAKKVSIVYRRRVADMTALSSEIEGAVAEGVEIVSLKAPVSIEVNSDYEVTGLRVQPQMISLIKDGRASVKANGEDEYVIPCDVLIKAIGQNIEALHFEEYGIPVNRGAIKTKSDGTVELFPGVFAGGDCATGPATVVKAIYAAKVCAANIDEYLGYHHLISADVDVPAPSIFDRTPCGRVNLTEREASIRKCDFEGIENLMTECECNQEASRCLRCDHFGFGIFKGGREKIW